MRTEFRPQKEPERLNLHQISRPVANGYERDYLGPGTSKLVIYLRYSAR
jgi:hypothetical protein